MQENNTHYSDLDINTQLKNEFLFIEISGPDETSVLIVLDEAEFKALISSFLLDEMCCIGGAKSSGKLVLLVYVVG